MASMESRSYIAAFEGERLLRRGPLRDVLSSVKRRFDEDRGALVLLFDDATGTQLDFDLRGSLADVLERAAPSSQRRGPGRPRLGVVSREVSLLPRHWAWLGEQPGSLSGTLRRLVDEAMRHETARDRARRAAAAAGRAMTALAGDREHFEEAYRALDAGDRRRFEALTASWPADVRAYVGSLAREAFAEGGEPPVTPP